MVPERGVPPNIGRIAIRPYGHGNPSVYSVRSVVPNIDTLAKKSILFARALGAQPIRGKGQRPPDFGLPHTATLFCPKMRMSGDSRKEFAVSAQSLPHRLTRLKDQAKQLLKDFQNGDSESATTFTEHHPRTVAPGQAKLADAQLVIARSKGFDSWPRLRRDLLGQQLRAAIWEGDLDDVESTLGEEPEIINDAGKHPRWGGEPTPLQLASERGQIDIVQTLLDQGAAPNGTGNYEWAPIHLAAHWGHLGVVQLLIGQNASVDIFAAALRGDTATVERMLDEDPSRATTPGLNEAPPLHVATNPDIARLLIDHGAALDTVDGLGNTPLGSAISRGERGRPVSRYLISQGASANPCQLAALGETSRLAETIDTDSSALSFTGKIGVNAVIGTPLHAAAAAGEVDAVRMLLSKGADPNARADMGQTALHNTSSVDVARLLVEAGADVSATDDEHGTTPLVWANVSIDIHGESESRRELVDYLKSETNAP